MTVYLVVNDSPPEFCGFQLVAIYLNKNKAKRKVENLKKKDPYIYQYYEVYARKTMDR